MAALTTEHAYETDPCSKQVLVTSDQASATPDCSCGSTADANASTEEGAAGILFNPPLYIQRYKLVTDFVKKTNARKVTTALLSFISLKLSVCILANIVWCSNWSCYTVHLMETESNLHHLLLVHL